MRKRLILLSMVAGLPLLSLAPSHPASAQTSAPYDFAAHGNFDAFLKDFRKAVAAGDRAAVARMTHFPFTDYRSGRFCEPGQKDCTPAADSRTRADAQAFLAGYDAMFSPELIRAILTGRILAYQPGQPDDAGPIAEGEYLLVADNALDELVFAKQDGRFQLVRVPFYS